MARKSYGNQSGIRSYDGQEERAAWIAYNCVSCHKLNLKKIGSKLIDPSYAYNHASWKCEHCGYIHSKNSDLPENLNWDDSYKDYESLNAQRFWSTFFKLATESKDAYWKQCATCGRILPVSDFASHSQTGKTGFLPLLRQRECKCCKAAINAKLNGKRTPDQMHEANIRRRIGDAFCNTVTRDFTDDELFKSFDGKCFKCKKELDQRDRKQWAIDHIMPSALLYPLVKNNAALLCKECNGKKRAQLPSEFYDNAELQELATIVNGNLELWSSKQPEYNKNNVDVNRGVESYLSSRNSSNNLNKKIRELKKVILYYGLKDQLTENNKKKLGFGD